MRKSTPQPISDVLKNVVEKLDRTKNKDIIRIFSTWTSIVGKELSRHTQPANLKKGILKVFVDDSAWFYQANLQKEELLQTLRKKIGERKIQDIQFRIGNTRTSKRK